MAETSSSLSSYSPSARGIPPVHRLPNELIEEFLSYVQIWLFNGPRAKTNPWLPFLLVCSRWRHVVLGAPRLWSIIHVGRSADRLAYFLSRSRDALKDIYLRNSVIPTTQQISLLAEHASRIRLLCYYRDTALNHHHLVDVVCALLSNALPALESINCISHPYMFEYYIPVGELARFPRLNCLGLRHSSLQGGTKNLRVISLDSCQWSISFQGFLDVLSGSPELEILSLTHTAYCDPESLAALPERSTTRLVALPRLRVLNIQDLRVYSAAIVMDHLETPAIARTELNFLHEYPQTQHVPSDVLPSDCPRIFPGSVHRGRAALKVIVSHRGFRGVEAVTDTRRIGVTLSTPDIRDRAPPSLPVVLQDAFTCFDYLSLGKLTVNAHRGAHDDIPAAFRSRVFKHCFALKWLELHGRSTYRTMWEGLRDAAGALSGEPCCPHLRKILLEGVFGALNDGDDTPYSMALQALQARAAGGAPQLPQLLWEAHYIHESGAEEAQASGKTFFIDMLPFVKLPTFTSRYMEPDSVE